MIKNFNKVVTFDWPSIYLILKVVQTSSLRKKLPKCPQEIGYELWELFQYGIGEAVANYNDYNGNKGFGQTF